MANQSAVADRIFGALSDRTRRRAFELLVESPMAVGELAVHLPVSRPAVSQHLKVLREAGRVEQARDGTRRVYSVDPHGIAPLREFVDRLWSDALERFSAAAESMQKNER